MLVTLRNSADKLNALLARLGRYSAAGSDKLERMDAGECVERVIRRYEAQHPVQIVERHHCDVLVDAEGFEQALVHLVQNAIEASDPNSPVLINATNDGLYCRVEVVDAGIGMSSEFVRSRLFKPFHSSKPGGFGIGVYEARELVRAMNGQLAVDSREGFGTRFTIRLPLAETARMAEEAQIVGAQDNAEVA
jgi:signal transduction histidine kinase